VVVEPDDEVKMERGKTVSRENYIKRNVVAVVRSPRYLVDGILP